MNDGSWLVTDDVRKAIAAGEKTENGVIINICGAIDYLRQQVSDLTERAERADAETLEAFTAADDWMTTAKLATTERDAALARAERAESEYDALTAEREGAYQSFKSAMDAATAWRQRAERAESEYDVLTTEYNALLDGGDPGGKLRTQLSELRRDYTTACRNTRAALVNQQRWQQEAEAARAEVARLQAALEDIREYSVGDGRYISLNAVKRIARNALIGSEYEGIIPKLLKQKATLKAERDEARAEVARLQEALEEIADYFEMGKYRYNTPAKAAGNCAYIARSAIEAAPTAHSEPADGPRLAPGDELPDDWTERDDEALGYAMMPPVYAQAAGDELPLPLVYDPQLIPAGLEPRSNRTVCHVCGAAEGVDTQTWKCVACDADYNDEPEQGD